MARHENWGEFPAGAFVVTAGADVQGDRVEIEFVAWGPGEESWSIDYRVVMGDFNALAPFVDQAHTGITVDAATLGKIYSFTGAKLYSNKDYVKALFDILGGWKADADAAGESPVVEPETAAGASPAGQNARLRGLKARARVMTLTMKETP
jgi:hypothetical protein